MPLIRDGDITTGWIRKKRPLFSLFFGECEPAGRVRVPLLAYNYAKRISELTGLPLKTVLRSKPVKSFVEKLSSYVEVELD